MDCPTEADLRKLCLGGLDDDREQAFVEHLEQCAACRSTIERLAAPLVGLTESLGSAVTDGDSLLLRERLDQLKLQRPSPRPSSTPQHQDLQPWIDEGDTDIGRVGHYDLIRCIGRGGMGVVFEAFDRELQRPVAVKMMSPALLSDPTNSQRLLREARAAATINCPLVVAIYAVSKTKDLPYLVMELVDGDSLQQRLTDSKTLDVDFAIEIAAQVTEALVAAHAKDVVHRDIKPANILLQRETDSVKLTDFGLAYTTSENPLTQTGKLIGTPEYLAPEQIDGGDVDRRSDLFSLGSVIYQMCAGHPPFNGQSLVATLREVTSTQPRPLRQANPKVPPWLSELVKQLHAKRPEDRIQNAESVLTALRSRAVQRSRKTPARVRPAVRRRRLLGFTGVAVILLALIGVAMTFLPSRDPQRVVAESAEDLFDHLEEQEGDLLIQLTSDEEFRLPQLYLEDRTVQIVAPEGSEAVFVFDETPEEPGIECFNGRLELVRIRISFIEDHDAESAGDAEDQEEDEIGDEFFAPAITCSGGSLVLNACEIDTGLRPCVSLVEADAELVASHLTSETHAINFEPTQTNYLRIDTCEVSAESAIDFVEFTGGRLSMRGTVVQSQFVAEFNVAGDADRQITLEIGENNRFENTEGTFAVYDVDPAAFTQSEATLLEQLPFNRQRSRGLTGTTVWLFAADDTQTRTIRFDQ